MLWKGLEKSLLSLRLKLMAQAMAQCNDDQSWVWYPSAIQVALKSNRHWYIGNSFQVYNK